MGSLTGLNLDKSSILLSVRGNRRRRGSGYDMELDENLPICKSGHGHKKPVQQQEAEVKPPKNDMKGEDTLIRYDHPILVSLHPEKKSHPRNPKGNINNKQIKVYPLEVKLRKLPAVSSTIEFPEPPSKSLLGPICYGRSWEQREQDEILNHIIPPRIWTDRNGNTYRQIVSINPATREEVIALEEQLNYKLLESRAKTTGLCPIRKHLYAQCFDEVLRQVTINCAERGLLLLAVRNEFRVTIDAYKTVYESASAYGARKALMSQKEKDEIQKKMANVSEAQRSAVKKLISLETKIVEMIRNYEEQSKDDARKRFEEVTEITQSNIALKMQLEALLKSNAREVIDTTAILKSNQSLVHVDVTTTGQA